MGRILEENHGTPFEAGKQNLCNKADCRVYHQAVITFTLNSDHRSLNGLQAIVLEQHFCYKLKKSTSKVLRLHQHSSLAVRICGVSASLGLPGIGGEFVQSGPASLAKKHDRPLEV